MFVVYCRGRFEICPYEYMYIFFASKIEYIKILYIFVIFME